MKKTKFKTDFWGLILLFCLSLFGGVFIVIHTSSTVTAKAEESIPFEDLTGSQCIEYIQSKGVEVPQELSGQTDIGSFVKSVIMTCVVNPDYSFHYNYFATQEFVQNIQSIINDARIKDNFNQGLTATASSYTLQDSTVYSDVNVEYYNCYAYSIGRTEYPNEYDTAFQYQPGDFSNTDFDIDMSIFTIAQIVKADLNALGYYDVLVSSVKPEVDSNAKLICVRKGTIDYHFMKYDSGVWYHKPGNTAILKYKYQPDDKLVQ